MTVRAALVPSMLALLGTPAVSSPLDDVWAQCFYSAKPHQERLETLRSSGWIDADPQAQRLSAAAMLISGYLYPDPGNPVLQTDMIATSFSKMWPVTVQYLAGQVSADMNRIPGEEDAHFVLEKDGAVLYLHWHMDAKKSETMCTVATVDAFDIAHVAAQSAIPSQPFDVPFARTYMAKAPLIGPDDERAGFMHAWATEPNMTVLKTYDPDTPQIGLLLSTYVSIWE